MQIIDNTIILMLICLAFVAGKRISDNYHNRIIEELLYQIKLGAAEKGLAYVPRPLQKGTGTERK